MQQPSRLTSVCPGSFTYEHSRIITHRHEVQSWEIVRANPPDQADMEFWKPPRPGFALVIGAHVGLYSLWAIP